MLPQTSCPSWLSSERRSAGCYGDVRTFPDGGRRCYGHQTDDDLDLIQSIDVRADAIGLEPRGERMWDRHMWPGALCADIPAQIRLLEWAEAHQLVRSYDVRHMCPSWFTSNDECPGSDGILANEPVHCPVTVGPWFERQPCPGYRGPLSTVGAFDHITVWRGPAGLRVVVGQPYVLSEAAAHALGQLLADEPTLHVTVSPPGRGWYSEHSTWLVLVVGFVNDPGQVAA